MSWLIKLVSVPVIMVLATGGTIGLIKVIQKACPKVFPKDGHSEEQNRE